MNHICDIWSTERYSHMVWWPATAQHRQLDNKDTTLRRKVQHCWIWKRYENFLEEWLLHTCVFIHVGKLSSTCLSSNMSFQNHNTMMFAWSQNLACPMSMPIIFHKHLQLDSLQCSFKMTWCSTKKTKTALLSRSLFFPQTYFILRLGCKSRWILLTSSWLDQASQRLAGRR